MSTTTKPEKKKTTTRQSRREFSARVKCEAVLAVWSERRGPTEVCRELGIKWGSLNHWQNQALSAMMTALGPKKSKETQRPPALGPKLEKLLERTEERRRRLNRLEKRLETIQAAGSEAQNKS